MNKGILANFNRNSSPTYSLKLSPFIFPEVGDFFRSAVKSQINTIFVHVSDLKKSVVWYARLLGQTYEPAEVSDPGPEGEKKVINPSPYPLFNFHTDDIHASFEFVANAGFQIESDIVEFDDFSFFTVKDPNNHIIMVCTG